MSQGKKKNMDLCQQANKYKAGRVGDLFLNV